MRTGVQLPSPTLPSFFLAGRPRQSVSLFPSRSRHYRMTEQTEMRRAVSIKAASSKTIDSYSSIRAAGSRGGNCFGGTGSLSLARISAFALGFGGFLPFISGSLGESLFAIRRRRIYGIPSTLLLPYSRLLRNTKTESDGVSSGNGSPGLNCPSSRAYVVRRIALRDVVRII